MKIGEMTGRQVLDAIARALEESGRPFERDEASTPDVYPAVARVAENARDFDRTS